MDIYFAPLEGITTYTYRKAHSDFFPMPTGYYAPFISPSHNERVSAKGFRDVMQGEKKPPFLQVMTKDTEGFFRFEEKALSLGFCEVNINLGCPSATVANKGRGSGQLKDVAALEGFLEEIFSKTKLKVSLKTRIGYEEPGEFPALLSVFNRFPLSRLIVHPRTRMEFYEGTPHMEVFEYAYHHSKNPLCYNGNIFSKADFLKVKEAYPLLDSLMLGRGALQNPAIFREIEGGPAITTKELVAFTKELEGRYLGLLKSPVFTLQKLKEVWTYMLWNYPEEKKLAKKLKKSSRLEDFYAVLSQLPDLQG